MPHHHFKYLCLVLALFSPLAFADNTLSSGERLQLTDFIESGNQTYRLTLQGDGNLVVRNRRTDAALYASGTRGNSGTRLAMQNDGNLVIYNEKNDAIWSTGTHKTDGDRLVMLDSGNLVIYTKDGKIVWETKTGSTPPATDTTKPVITLNGSSTVTLTQGQAFSDPGATANDDIDGNISSKITISGAVNINKIGNYLLAYNVKDKAENAADTVIRTVKVVAKGTPTEPPPPVEGGNGSNTDNDGTASSTGQFSAPSAALYTLNSAKQRTFPVPIDTKFSGNGHAETWDGRIFVRTQTDGWFASAFRPERISVNSSGVPSFSSGAFGNSIAFELNKNVRDMQHNWIAIVPDFDVKGENPYPSNNQGNLQADGTYRTYKAIVFNTSLRNNDNDQVGFRKATFIISNANTGDAQLISAKFTSNFERIRTKSGEDFRCIEPTVTLDARLIVCQGNPANDGRIGNLVYGWNSTQGATTGWTTPRSIADMYEVDRNVTIAGIPFRVRYPIANTPIRDADGKTFAKGELIKGAYPWISHDGSELFYQASRDGREARRGATSVVGRWTGGIIRHIDGPINRNRYATSRLFVSSPGAFTTMWSPYKDVANLAIPYSVKGPSYPIFGSNSKDYSEIGFDDFLDGNYVMYLGMNEQINREGNYLMIRTPDTSGNLNNATLVGAKFPYEFNRKDEIIGRVGQAIYFNSGNHLTVNRTRGWDTLAKEGITIDMFVRVNSGSGNVRLFTMQSGIELLLSNGSRLTANLEDSKGIRKTLSGNTIPLQQWVHVALTYNAFNQEMHLYQNGARVASSKLEGFGALRTTGNIYVGPINSTASLILDEVKVSNVARREYEIAHNAFTRSHRAPSSTLTNTIPAHLASLRNTASSVDRFSTQAAELGKDLFEDVILSKNLTTSCATCHDSKLLFTDGLAIAKGKEPTDAGKRNTPSLQNRLFSSHQGWSGSAITLDTQALIPIQAAHEMNLTIDNAVIRLTKYNGYASRFKQVYGEAPNSRNIQSALASFQATLYAKKNRVDEFKEGNISVLTSAEKRGMVLFEGKARCSGCHAGKNYTDESFRNNGLVDNNDIGRADSTGRNRDYRLFKVPSLRDVEFTAPYMHDGSMTTLTEVVNAYDDGAANDASVDTDIRPLELTTQEKSDLISFLKSLSGN